MDRTTPAFVTLAGTGLLSVNADVVRATASVIYTGMGAMSVNLSLQTTAEARFAGASSLQARAQVVHFAAARFDGAGSASWDVLRIGLINVWQVEARFAGAGRMRVAMLRKHPATPRDDTCVVDPRTDLCTTDPRVDTDVAIARN
jgi:hypothetical protein